MLAFLIKQSWNIIELEKKTDVLENRLILEKMVDDKKEQTKQERKHEQDNTLS